jgi:hypothetical protein
VDTLLTDLARNSPVIGSTLLIVWLSLPQLAERFEVVRKLVAPFSKKQRQRSEDAEESAKRDRQSLLADAQAVAQTTATKATTDALVVVNGQYSECRKEVQSLRDVSGKMIDVLEELLPMVPVEHRANARATIRLARALM